MQNFRSFGGTESDSEISAPPVEIGAFGPRLSALELLRLLGSGSVAGLAFGVADLARASSAVGGRLGWPIAAAVLALWLWFGQALAVAMWLARTSGAAIKRRLPTPIAWHALLTFVAGAVTLLLARKVLASGGIRQPYLASLGSWVITSCAVLTVWVAVRTNSKGRTHFSRWAVVAFAAALSVGAVVLDACALGGYLYLHILLLTLGLVLASQVVQLIRIPLAVRHAALATSLLSLPSLIDFPASRQARELLARPTWAGLQLIDYVQFHWDLDHDGQSPAFGGGDCDDADASVFLGATELPADKRDSNCDGVDDPTTSALVFKPFQNQADRLVQEVSERAKRLPTVVILVDALRFDRVGNPRFPNLALLAGESIRLSHVYATSATTLSSVPAMMTGSVRPAPGRENIAQSLARAGQSSRFIAPDVVTEHFKKLERANPILSFSSHESIATDHAIGWGGGNSVSTSEQITARAIRHVDSARPPDLLWLHYFDVHQWNELKEQGLPPRGDVARYDAVLERLDASLRPLLARRDRLNLVLLADHGEALGARGIRYHANYVFQELAHIPFLVRVPGIEPILVDVPVTSTGVFNMLRDLRGLDPDTTADPNVLQLVGATDVGEGPGFAGFDTAQWSFLFGNHRLLYMPHQQLVELYDLRQDPLEQKNQADENPQLVSGLLTRLFKINNESRK